jgi:hypothetical protein
MRVRLPPGLEISLLAVLRERAPLKVPFLVKSDAVRYPVQYTVIGYYLHPVIDIRIVCDTYYIFSGCHGQYLYLRKKKSKCFVSERISCTPLDPNIA